MTNLLRAEWHKLSRHITLVLFTLGVLPIGVGLLLGFQVILLVFNPGLRAGVEPHNWIAEASTVWGVLNSEFSVFGRVLPIAFMGVAFAAEYQSGTWKTALPGNRRAAVLLAKVFIITVMTWGSFVVMAGIAVAGFGVISALSGNAYGPQVVGQGWVEFLMTFGRESLLGLYTLLFLGWVAALVAIYARSAMVVVVAVVIISGLENVAASLLYILSRSLNRPEVMEGYKFTPAYNLLNLRSWLTADMAYNLSPPLSLQSTPDALFSGMVLAAWLVGLAVLTLRLFQRQDITS